MEMEPGEGAAHEKGEPAEEEVREGTEASEKETYSKKPSRKRSPKGAKRTKAPMDSEGCGCGGKKGATCDGNCGSGMKKGRSDALTPQEYLAACDLGIQGRSRHYIRARLDMAERMDKKCGASGIADNKKCNVGSSSVEKKPIYEPNLGDRVRAGWAGFNAGLSAFTAGENLSLALKHKSAGHAIAALGNLGGAALNFKAGSEYTKGRTASGYLHQLGGVGANVAGTTIGSAVAESDFRKRQANYATNKSNYTGKDPFKDLGLSSSASASEVKAAYRRMAAQHHPDRGGDPQAFLRTKTAYEEILRRQGRGKATRDSMWAEGFKP